MKNLKCLVLLSAYACLSVSGMRVPSVWGEVSEQQDIRNFNGGILSNPRFGKGGNSDGRFQRRAYVENLHANGELGALYNTLQTSALEDFFQNPSQMMVLGNDGLYRFPQITRQNVAFASEITQPENTLPLPRNSLPPLLNPRYPEKPKLQNSNLQFERRLDDLQSIPVPGRIQFHKTRKMPVDKLQNEVFEKYQTLPSEILRIRPTSSGNVQPNYRQIQQAKFRQPVINQLNPKFQPLVHKEYVQNPISPSYSYETHFSPPGQSLNRHVPQNHKFIVSASEEDSSINPPNIQPTPNSLIELTTKKEPVFFVTEGYTNVLVQGPNKKKKYQKHPFQNKEESKHILNSEKIGEREATGVEQKVVEKPPRKRKVTKIYKVQENNEEKEDNLGGSNRNLVESSREKPRRYFEGPQSRSRLRNYEIKNYRDDRLHEPSEDHDSEREDEDKEKIDNDDEKVTEEETETEDKSKENKDNTEPKSEEIEEAESDDDEEEPEEEESDEGEAEGEEEEQQEVPHSEHDDPKPVPTKPIYPGEGVWAKPGRKHRPYVSQHKFIKPEEDEQNPDGHEVFEELAHYFESQKDQFGRTFGQKIDPSVTPVPNSPVINEILSINQPNPVNPILVYDPFNESSNRYSQQLPKSAPVYNKPKIDDSKTENTNLEQNREKAQESEDQDDENDTENEEIEESDEGEESGDDKSDDFVPVQLYTQVRKNENEEHEPYDPLEHGRLREVIKDSKIHSVYTEEGYEDAAYDHAGHEKQAEKDQGHEEFEREKLQQGKPIEKKESDSNAALSNKILKTDNIIQPLQDSLAADSVYPALPEENHIETTNSSTKSNKPPKSTNNNNFITMQEVKTTQVKDKKNGDVQLEIESEVKFIVQPNNSTKAHKYVKIYPKVLREYSVDVPENTEQENSNKTEDVDAKKELVQEEFNAKDDKTGIIKSQIGELSDTSTETTEKEIKSEVNLLQKAIKDTDSSTEASIKSTSTETNISPNVFVKSYTDEFDKNKASTEKPKVVVRVLDSENDALKKISDQFFKIGGKVNRQKRSTDDNKDLEIDIGFIDKINHTFAEKEEELDVQKYPYYTMPGINENSPLRYAENMENIPVKIEGELSFYKMADKQECPDIPQNIDPIPEHIKNADKLAEKGKNDDYDEEDEEEEDGEESEEESVVDQKHPPPPKTPRIQLGDKIDCLKARYFGVNPLDSPFFKEETVGPVKSIFKELDQKSNNIQNKKYIDSTQKTSEIVKNIVKVNEIFDKKDKQDVRKFETQVKDKIYNALNVNSLKKENGNNGNSKLNTLFSLESENVDAESIRSNVRVLKPTHSVKVIQNQLPNTTPLPLVTLITTPKYTIQLTPKNIYDQIKLLDHLPEDDLTETVETSTRRSEEITTIKEVEIPKDVTTEAGKNNAEKPIPQTVGKEESSRREAKVLTPGDQEQKVPEKDTSSIEAQALRRRRLRPRKPIYQIFDVNTFLTTTPFSVISPVHSTVLPKYKVVSEVFYKDEIKPNEQLNVFADVLNNIKNSTNVEVPLQSASDFAEPSSVTISSLEETSTVLPVQTSSNVRVKKYQQDSSNDQNSIHRHAIQNQESTEKTYNARYPMSYEEQRHYTYNPINKKVVDITTHNPNNFGYVTKDIQSKLENSDSYNDNIAHQPYSPPDIKVGNRKILKRRRKPTKGTTSTTFRTTTNINVPDQTIPSNHQPYVIDFLEDTEHVVGLVPPTKYQYKTIVEDSEIRSTNDVPKEVFEYKTIQPNAVTEPITSKLPAPVTELSDESPPIRALNKYFFLGLKPPLYQRAQSYTEFIDNNNFVNKNVVRRRAANNGHGYVRIKREADRATYSDVSRNRGRQNEGLDKSSNDDIDDYVPHRPKNYHYDEKTGKIVYHNKPKVEEETEDYEEYEEIEIPDTPGKYLERAEDATHPTPKKVTTKPLLATATPPPEGQGLLDFVAKLKNNPTYKYIPDPTTPEPGKEPPTTQDTVTVDPKSTNPPEFLNILSKVRSDSSYKFIEDPKESKGKSRSTTPEPEDEEEDEEEEDDEELGAIQNSPGGQTQDLSNIQIFDIGDYLPKIKNIEPKTSIDYSKYKTIERPHVRHNMSSRYNSEEESLEEVITRRRPIIEEKEIINKETVGDENVVRHTKVEAVSEEPVSTTTTTTQRIVQFRRGTRPTTQRTTAEYVEPTEAVTRRTAHRRRPLPSGFRTTVKPTTTEVTEATEKVERIYPQNTQTERTYSQTHDQARRVYRRRPVRIRHTTERQEEDEESVDKIVRRSLDSEFDDVRNEFEKEALGS